MFNALKPSVFLSLDENLTEKWVSGGAQSKQMYPAEAVFPNLVGTVSCSGKQFVTNGNVASLNNIYLSAKDLSKIHVGFQRPANKTNHPVEYTYQVIQKRSSDSSIVGGETFKIIVPAKSKSEITPIIPAASLIQTALITQLSPNPAQNTV